MEAGDGIEPTHESFADSRITTLLSGLVYIIKYFFIFCKSFFKLCTGIATKSLTLKIFHINYGYVNNHSLYEKYFSSKKQ